MTQEFELEDLLAFQKTKDAYDKHVSAVVKEYMGLHDPKTRSNFGFVVDWYVDTDGDQTTVLLTIQNYNGEYTYDLSIPYEYFLEGNTDWKDQLIAQRLVKKQEEEGAARKRLSDDYDRARKELERAQERLRVAGILDSHYKG